MNNILKNTIIITAITVVAGLLLGIVYQVTKEPIAKANEEALNKAYAQVLCEADTFEDAGLDIDIINADLPLNGYEKDAIKSVVVGKSGDEVVGYVINVLSKEGFGGDIEFSVGIKADGTTEGISFLSLSETAGLGMKANEPQFKDQFANKLVDNFEYTKTGSTSDSEIDALSGATITTNAVTNGVNAALFTFNVYIGGAN